MGISHIAFPASSKARPRTGDAIIRRVALLIDGAIWGLIVLPAILVIWGVYDRMNDAANDLLALRLFPRIPPD